MNNEDTRKERKENLNSLMILIVSAFRGVLCRSHIIHSRPDARDLYRPFFKQLKRLLPRWKPPINHGAAIQLDGSYQNLDRSYQRFCRTCTEHLANLWFLDSL